MTRSRKRGHFPQNSDCVLDISVDSAKSAVYAREKSFNASASRSQVTVLRVSYSCLPWFRDILVPIARRLESLYTNGSRYTYTMFGQFLLHNRAAANGHGGSPSRLCRRVAALVAGRLLSRLHRSEVRQWELSALYLVVILLELTLEPISTHSHK